MRGLLLVAGLVLVVYALVDCVRSPGAEVRGLPKPLWVLIILLAPGLGALAWLYAGRGRGPSAPPPARSGPLAPDDDPDFLWRLEQERRRARDDGKRGSDEGGPSGQSGPAGAAGPDKS